MKQAITQKQFDDGIKEIIQIDDNLFQAFITWRHFEAYIDTEGKAEDIRKAGYKIDSINTAEKWVRFSA